MPTPSYTVTCTGSDTIAQNIYEVRFAKPKEFQFQAGHFVLFDVPLLDDLEDIQPRAYSIGSSPQDDELLFAIKLIPDGRMSTFLEKKLAPGMELRMQGPFGKFTLDRNTHKEYVMLCTATGIAPFRSHLRTYLPEETRSIHLFFGLLHERELFWKEELDAMAKQYPNFSYYVEASEPLEGWDGFRGYVQEHAAEVIDDFSNKQVYLCGSPLMTKAVKDVAINEWGVPKEDVHMEGFI